MLKLTKTLFKCCNVAALLLAISIMMSLLNSWLRSLFNPTSKHTQGWQMKKDKNETRTKGKREGESLTYLNPVQGALVRAVQDLLLLVQRDELESLVIAGIRKAKTPEDSQSMYTCIYPGGDMFKVAGLGSIINQACIDAAFASAYPAEMEVDEDEDD